jgi:hypothetical protein
LLKASHKLAEEMYKTEQAKAGAGAAAGGDEKKDGVVDAEVVDDKDGK